MDVTVRVGEQYPAMLLFACALSLVGGVYGLWLTHRRQYQHAALAAGVLMVGVLAAFNLTFSRAARKPGGDEVIAITQLTREAVVRTDLPIVFYETGNVPVQALLGRNEPMDAAALQRAATGALVLTSDLGMVDIRRQFLFRAEHLAQTEKLAESGRVLHLVHIRAVE
jgi:drug/metabolite transporter superfamily protein YnfA